MKKNIAELLALLVLIGIMVWTPLAIGNNSPWKNHGKIRMINITAVASQGIFTEDVVNGLNIWNTNFKRANIILVKGEKVKFRFTSADVTHTFYVPEANLCPIVVEAGHFYDVYYTPQKSGKFTYYCISVCGHCHNYMRGNFAVIDKSDMGKPDIVKAMTVDTIRRSCCISGNAKLSLGKSYIKNGKMLFTDKGCYLCHGENGIGGIVNPNYAKITIPTLNNLASKLQLRSKEDADIVINLIEKGSNLDKAADDPPFPAFSRFYAQYNSIITKIKDGAPVVQKTDVSSFDPPLCMPSWEYQLSSAEINSIICYLINIYDWEND